MEEDLRTPLIEVQGRASSSGTSSFIKACFNATNAFLGIGLLTVPYALASGGWLTLSLFIVTGLITFYTGLLLKRCMDIDPSIQTYLDIADRAFGKTGRIMVLVIMNSELYLVAIGLLILEGDNLHKLFPGFDINLGTAWTIDGRRSFILITALAISPTMFLVDLGILSYVSATGVVSCLAILVSVVSVGLFDGVGFHEEGVLLDFGGIGTAVSLFIVCFAGHPVIPSIYTSMKHPHQFSKVLLVGFFLTATTYTAMAVLSYLMYGDEVETQITLNLPTQAVASKVAIYTTLLIPITRYALMVTPIANALESYAGLSKSDRENRTCTRILIRLGLLLSTLVFAYLFPYFESLISLVGSVFVVLASFVLPCLCYAKIVGLWHRRIWNREMVGILAILVFAVVAGVWGTCSDVIELVQDV